MQEKTDKNKVRNMFEKNKGTMFSGAGTGLKRAQMCYFLVIAMVLLVHFLYVLLFQAYGNNFFMWYNVEVVLFYAWVLLMTTRRRYRMVVTMVHLEVILYSSVSVIVFGWDYGFAVFLIVLASMIYLNPFSKEHAIFAFSILEAIVFLVLWGYTISHEPLDALGKDAASVFRYINYCSCFIGIIMGAGMSQLSVHSLTTASNRIFYNQVTKVFSREYFYQCFREILAAPKKGDYTLLCIRVVDFPLYREFYGQEKAEEVLRSLANYLNQSKNHLLFGHISSDIFGLVLEKETFSEKEFTKGLEEISEQFSNERYRMHIAVGVYDIADASESPSIHCERGRMALTEAQKDVSHPVVYFDTKMLEKNKLISNIVAEFEQALEKGEFRMYLQPQIERDGSLHGAETLVRWLHPEKGLISPAVFISVLEDAGLICRLDSFIWEEAAKCLKRWKETGKEKYSLSINISVRDFYHLDLYKHFTELVKKYGIPPEKLKLEITETVLMTDPETKLDVIRRLRNDGFIVEIDDFGSGYSSLNMLKDFDADVLKIDMIFLRGTIEGDRGRNIIRSVINLSKQLSMSTVSEGVETREQYEDLKNMGCDVFQGTYFSKPIPVEVFEEKYFGAGQQ